MTLSPEQKKKPAEYMREYYAKIRADPIKYEEYKAKRRDSWKANGWKDNERRRLKRQNDLEYAEQHRQRQREKYWKYHDKYIAEQRKRNATPEAKEASKLRKQKARTQVLNHYSNGDIKCKCCSEKELSFMSLDHINDNGWIHRKTVKQIRGSGIYFWLIRNGLPEGYQVLCMNCNFAKGILGYCPHTKQ